jgi:hypothetical protein
MASNLRVDQITASTTGSVSIGTATFTGGLSGDITGLNVTGVITATTLNQNVTGAVTATDGFVVGTGATISGSTNTITASTNGSERVRVDSSGNVGIGTDTPQEKLQVQGDVRLVDNSPRIGFHDANASTNIQCTGGIEIFDQNGNRGAYMGATEGSNFLSFGISPSAGASPTEKLRITSGGDVNVSDGNLVIGTSGHGISFAATGGPTNGTGTSELLDDYEEGTWTPGITNLGNHTNVAASTWGKYTKIGNRVFVTFRYQWVSRSTTNGSVPVYLDNLPFTSVDDGQNDGVYIGGIEGVIASNSGRPHYGGSVLANNTRIIFRASGEDVSENSLQGSNATSLSSGYIYGGANYIVS